MNARTEILGRVRRALEGVRGHQAAQVAVARDYRHVGAHAAGSPEVLEILVDRLVDYKAHVHRVETSETVTALLGEILGEATSVVVPHGLEQHWLDGLATGTSVRTDEPAAPLSALDLDEIDAVVTAARVAVADTGTIVLDGSPDQGRRAITLVPDVHVCVLHADQVVHTVPEGVAILAAHPERPQTWISGPSATSDIELSRVEGVHGPRTLHVVIVG